MIILTSIIKNGLETQSDVPDELIYSISQGNTDAFETLYKTMKSSVYGYALSILKNTYDAEDVLHDCFVNIYKAAPSYRGNGKGKSWIMTIAHNLCIQKLRERNKTSDFPQDERELYLELPPQASADDKIVLEKCMKALSDEERQIIVLHAVTGFKHREIASIMGIPLPTVLSKYNRSIKKLRELYNGGESDDQ